jgi:hypothetical protein
MKRIVRSRKLLVASVGVASVLYACEKPYPPGNLVAPPPTEPDAGMVTSGNLMAPVEPPPQPSASTSASAIEPVDASTPPSTDAGAKAAPSASHIPLPHRPPGNLMPPPPPPNPTPPKPKK